MTSSGPHPPAQPPAAGPRPGSRDRHARGERGPTGRDRVAAVAGIASVAVFAAGQYVAPALVWPEEQVGGVQHSCYALYEGRLLAEAICPGWPPGPAQPGGRGA
jgi:hypothetical protein